ncbi:MAG: hypothetical protein AUJ51_08035 [Elusimicrobia bacterium CG1_02_56_21]|nr:MAG: hypothetical protein AUJ51_08035 [Elusimicrobia bacterium CG1_02_56_21]
MKSKNLLNLLLAALFCPAIVNAQEGAAGKGWFNGTLAPKLSIYEYVGGGNAADTRFLQRYDYQKGWSDRGVSGAYLDLDLDLSYSNGKDSIAIQRKGYGFYTHSGMVRMDSELVNVSGFYSQYRSASVGLDYRNRANNVTGGTDAAYTGTGDGYVARFNNDSGGSPLRLDRTNYGVGIKSKSGPLRDIPSVSVKHEGYNRTGNTYATWVSGGGDFQSGFPLRRWHGYDKPVNELMGRTSANFTASPLNWFQLAYDASFEKFENQARGYTIGDFKDAYYPAMTAANQSKPLHFIQDSTLNSNSLRLSKTFKNSSLAAGYGMSVLSQDSFATKQTDNNYKKGEIATNNFFLSGKCLAIPSVETEAYVKTANRWNNSTRYAAGLFNDPTNKESLDLKLTSIKSAEYGFNATLRPAGSKNSLGAGWKHETKKRGFLLGTNAGVSIPSQRILYKADSESDTVFLKGAMRPVDGLVLHLTPSYQKAAKVGTVAEAQEALNVKTDASYVTAGGKVLGFYYSYSRTRNTGLDYTAMTGAVTNNTMSQNIHNVLHSAGASLSAAFTAKTNSSVSVDWNQSDFQNFYNTSNKRRYETALLFTNHGKSKSLINTTTLAMDTDWQVKENLKLTGGYALSRSEGDIASGLIATELASTNDGAVDNYLHVLSVGADYAYARDVSIKGRYAFDRYQDKQYSSLSGSGHTLTASLAYKF